MKKFMFSFFFLIPYFLFAQEYFPVNTGVKSNYSGITALKNAKIFVSSKEIIENGILVIKKGKIVDVGAAISIPKNAQIIDLKGKSIYPSFIDVYSNFGVAISKPKTTSNKPQYDASRSGYYWNDHMMPSKNAAQEFSFDEKKASELRKYGFGAVNTHIEDGIHRGTGTFVTLNSNSNNSERIIAEKSSQYLSFSKSKLSNQAYPTSLMGAMALLRQFYYDADWYATGNVTTTDLSLAAYNNIKNLPQIFYAGDKSNVLRADKVGDLFNIQYAIVGKGNEYELVEEIKKTNATLILPLNFPKAYDVEDPFQANYLTIKDMRYWNQAPSNPKILAENGISFSLTTHSSKSLEIFQKNLLKAIEYGLSKEAALDALTIIPAKIIRKENEIGTLKKGMIANFLITSGDVFNAKTVLYENWIQGHKNVVNPMHLKNLSGKYDLLIGNISYKMNITGEIAKPKISIEKDSIKFPAKIVYNQDWVSIIIDDHKNFKKLSTKVSKNNTDLLGEAIVENGVSTTWKAKKVESDDKAKKTANKSKVSEIVPITYPNVGFGFKEKPKTETILFKNATVWTNEAEGILQETDVLIKNGKIEKIGKNLNVRNATTIDATGKHLTTGIIDEHSHIAAIQANEAGQNSSAEVTLEDVIDFEDVNLYRNLAGGVTTMQVLHGSANPIGGRSAIIKLKWGEIGDNLIYSDSPKFIKFALGENVKQSNWGDDQTVRFPQTRMGVEQVFIDYFQRAKEYDAIKKSGKSYRVDLELETLAEIINKERFITCHSYVQSEINMLMKVADQFNFNVNTFTHILEGYKVADKMVEHGVGGSTFSDWWAYKYEVNDAIPYNAAIMHNAGVTVAINSDDREMSRRLNQEAAKTIKYGGVSEEDAWKFVTLNPAKLLHIDHRVGSIKVGKDADLVLWNQNPLSIYAKAEKTIIEGKVYFDIQKDLKLRAALKEEKNQLIDLMLAEKIKGAAVQKPKKSVKKELHCDSL